MREARNVVTQRSISGTERKAPIEADFEHSSQNSRHGEQKPMDQSVDSVDMR
jgi:hypothetical protein